MCTGGAAPTLGQIDSDYHPKPEAAEPLYSHFIQPLPGLFVAPSGNRVALGDDNTLART
jgi:hypothetical protein